MAPELDHMLCAPCILLPGPRGPQTTSVATANQLPAPGSREGKVLPAWQWREDRYADITRARDHSASSEGLEGDKVLVLEELGRKGPDGFLV